MKNKIYFLIPLSQIFLVLFSSYFFITETNDSKSYYSIASNLPIITDSLFPILYPSFLKLFYFFVGDFFVASKVINIICILLFFFMTKMHIAEWKSLWLLSLSWLFSSIFSYSWSEILLIPQLTLFFILQRRYWNNELIKTNVFILLYSVQLFSLFLTKYSMLFIIIGTFVFGLLIYLHTNHKKHLIHIYSSIIAFFFCGAYVFTNYYFTSYFAGNREVLGEANTNIRLSLFNTLQAFNPFFSNLFGRMPFLLVSILFIFSIILYFIRASKMLKENKLENMYFIFLSFFYLISLWIVYFYTRIDTLNIRLLFPFCFLFFLGLIANDYKIKYFKLFKYLLIIMFILQIIISFNRINQYY
ncbi:hypothetical protein [Cloacibacterium sp.]|uniref:hypothetical protein n=1 Tax=Cloacibacterium sp. TaxID=1913682 RepID=UPI0039E4C063